MKRLVLMHQKTCFFHNLFFMVTLTLSLGTAALLDGHAQQPAQPPLVAASRGGGVYGTIVVRVQEQAPTAATSGHLIYLPDFEVFLQNVVSGELSQPVKTDLFGHFLFPTQKSGTYNLRWEQQRGWQEGVLAKEIVITNGTAYPDRAEIKPQAGRGLLFGQVKRADGSSPWVHDEFFGINLTTQVVALDADGNKVAEPVSTNTTGGFAIAGLPKAPLQLRATSEAAVAVEAISASALSFGGPVSPVTLTFNQPRPQILSIVPKLNQMAVRTVTPGATVTVTVDARSFGQNTLKFDWRLQERMGVLNAIGAVANWTLPIEPGRYTAFVLVSDGFAGYTVGSVSVQVETNPGAFAAQSQAVGSTSPGKVNLSPALSASPVAALPTPSPTPDNTRMLNLKGFGSPATAQAYYKTVDPKWLRTYKNGDVTQKLTLGDWWSVNGFDPNGNASGQVRTSYLNNNDLGSGRDMHFLQHPDGTVSAYVTNYLHNPGHFDQKAMSADDAAAQVPAPVRAATVCMEWRPVEGSDSTRVVKFFAYDAAPMMQPPGSGTLLEGVDLIGGGATLRYVPHLCLECHGGTYNTTTDLGASFREFDTATFKYTMGRLVPNATEQAAFKRQNLIVRGRAVDSISCRAIKQLVNGWYGIREIQVQGGVPNKDVLYIDPHPTLASENNMWYPTPGWSESKKATDAYINVVAKSCRTCHVAFSNQNIDWTTSAQFLSNDINDFVFVNLQMPHAPVTFKNFWSTPGEAQALLDFITMPP
jgi:hypothetical protein